MERDGKHIKGLIEQLNSEENQELATLRNRLQHMGKHAVTKPIREGEFPETKLGGEEVYRIPWRTSSWRQL